jgi:hypothetical protein
VKAADERVGGRAQDARCQVGWNNRLEEIQLRLVHRRAHNRLVDLSRTHELEPRAVDAEGRFHVDSVTELSAHSSDEPAVDGIPIALTWG